MDTGISKFGSWFKFKKSNPKYLVMVGVQTTGSGKWKTIRNFDQHLEVSEIVSNVSINQLEKWFDEKS